MLISGTRGARFQSVGILVLGVLLLFGSIAQQIVEPLAFIWLAVVLGTAITAFARFSLWREREKK
jgi:hypothetical protein